MSTNLFETKLSGNMVIDTMVLGSHGENATQTPIRNQVFAVDRSTDTFVSNWDGYIGFAPYMG